jgi:hypothetical protein
MKKVFITCLASMAFVFSSLAQVDHDYNVNDLVPVVTFELARNQIPPAVLSAANKDFSISDPQSWTKFPYALKEYGWVYDKGASDVKPNRYEVKMTTSNGSEFYAVYSAEGNLIATREMSINVPIPQSVKESLSNSKYKDWTVVGNKEVIRYYHDKKSVEQHFRVTVEKDNSTKSISFNYQGTADNTANKMGN